MVWRAGEQRERPTKLITTDGSDVCLLQEAHYADWVECLVQIGIISEIKEV